MANDVVISTKNSDLGKISTAIQKLNKQDVANLTSAGFIYQDLVLMKELLYLENNSTIIEYEVLDDIDIIRQNSIELIQIKSSINELPLTDSSNDFWKTINKWANVITTIKDLSKLNFVFYTNRKISEKASLCNELLEQKRDYAKIIIIIRDLFIGLNVKENLKKANESPNPIFKYVKKIHELNDKDKKLLFQKITFEISKIQIIDEIKTRLEFFGITKQEDIDRIYENLLGIITHKRYELALEKQKFVIDFNYFRKDLKFNTLLNLAKYEAINFDEYYLFKNDYDEDFADKIFYKQLLDIDINKNNITNYARERAKVKSFFNTIDIVPSEEEIINKKIVDEWSSVYENIYDDKIIMDDLDHILKAKECLRSTKNSTITYKTSTLPNNLVIGKVIDLSDTPIIGWRKNWEEKYSE